MRPNASSTCGKHRLKKSPSRDMTDKPITYKDAGVDIDKKRAAIKRIRGLARATYTRNVLSEIGSFGGLFACDFQGMPNPVLVSSADGVGTKLKVRCLAVKQRKCLECMRTANMTWQASLWASLIVPELSTAARFNTVMC